MFTGDSARQSDFSRAVRWVALLNLAYFGIEFAVADAIGSVSLLADSIDFLEDAATNGLILLALTLPLIWRVRVGMGLAVLLLVPGLATLAMALNKLATMAPPEPVALTLTGAGALAVNVVAAFMIARFRHEGGSLVKVAYLSARNDAIANIAIIIAGGLTAVTVSAWPDLVVGLAIAVMNADAVREVWRAAKDERATPPTA